MRELTRPQRLGVQLDMGPSRRATSEPYGQTGSKIQPAAREGYGPPPHVKPHALGMHWLRPITSPQQQPPGAAAHTRTGAHETRGAPVQRMLAPWERALETCD